MASFPEYVRISSAYFKSAKLLTRVFQNKDLYKPLAEVDPEVQNIIDKETWRQWSGLELIASEVHFGMSRTLSCSV